MNNGCRISLLRKYSQTLINLAPRYNINLLKEEPGYRIQTDPTQSATLIPDTSLTYSRRNLDTGYKLIILMEEPGYQIQAESTQGGTSIPDTSWSYSRRNPDTGYKLNLLKEGTWIPDTSWTYSRRNLDTRYKLNLLKVEPEYRIQADPTQGGTRIPDTSWTYSRGEAEYNKIHENLCLELWNWKSWDRRGIIIHYSYSSHATYIQRTMFNIYYLLSNQKKIIISI